jgi:hypothetical protein
VLNVVRLLAIAFTALTMAAGFAHLLELPNKIRLPRDAYLTVQTDLPWLGVGTRRRDMVVRLSSRPAGSRRDVADRVAVLDAQVRA